MEKLDAAIGIVGGLVVLAAALLVGLQSVAAGYQVAFVEAHQGIGEGNRRHFAEGAFRDDYALAVDAPLAGRVNVSVRVDFLPAAQGSSATLDAFLRAPNGTEYEAEATWNGAPGAPASASVSFDVEALARPPSAFIDASNAAEAEGRAASAAPRSPAVGAWALTVRFASGPVPVSASGSSWEGRVVVWTPEATAVGRAAK